LPLGSSGPETATRCLSTERAHHLPDAPGDWKMAKRVFVASFLHAVRSRVRKGEGTFVLHSGGFGDWSCVRHGSLRREPETASPAPRMRRQVARDQTPLARWYGRSLHAGFRARRDARMPLAEERTTSLAEHARCRPGYGRRRTRSRAESRGPAGSSQLSMRSAVTARPISEVLASND